MYVSQAPYIDKVVDVLVVRFVGDTGACRGCDSRDRTVADCGGAAGYDSGAMQASVNASDAIGVLVRTVERTIEGSPQTMIVYEEVVRHVPKKTLDTVENTFELLQVRFIDQVVNVPVVMQRQTPAVQTIQKTTQTVHAAGPPPQILYYGQVRRRVIGDTQTLLFKNVFTSFLLVMHQNNKCCTCVQTCFVFSCVCCLFFFLVSIFYA